ncbi:MAG: dihydroorotase [Elusimicrobia bacterium]|nr:dihydroorotase [Elusimicrobiota bacterium]
MSLIIQGGRVLDPQSRRDGVFDILIDSGKVVKKAKKISPSPFQTVFPAQGYWVMPGLIDVHVHLREPGGEISETIATGTRAAAAGGVTGVLAMANTQPPTDTPEKVRYILKQSEMRGAVRVYPVGAVTRGLDGQDLTDFPAMAAAGCRAFSDDGRCVMNSGLLKRALEESGRLGVPIIEHCEDENLSRGGSVHEGKLLRKLGCAGIPRESETIMVARDLFLAQATGSSLHCAHVSCADSVEMIRQAKKKGAPVTAECCPHHFTLTEEAVARYGSSAKMKPPLRTQKDLESVWEGLADDTIDCIATDHAPHDPESKRRPLREAPFGVIGLETLWSLVYNRLILKRVLTPLEAARKLTESPAKIFHLPGGTLRSGSPADIAIFNPKISWTLKKDEIISKSDNTPFLNWKFKGKIVATIVSGKIVYQNY